jgi:hypothetical protein
VLQPQFLTALNPEERIPALHPLRAIKSVWNEALRRLSPLFEELYSDYGRACIPPEPFEGGFERIRPPTTTKEDSSHTTRIGNENRNYPATDNIQKRQQCRRTGVRPHVSRIDKRRLKGLEMYLHLSPGAMSL